MAKLAIEPNVQYQRHLKRWKKIRDIIDGEARLKESDLSVIGISTYNNTSITGYDMYGGGKNVNVNAYLRIINPSDVSDYNRERNAGYICGARLFNATERTLSGLMGMLYRAEPEAIDLGGLEYLIEDVDGTGTGIVQQSQAVSSDIIQIGRDGLLVDMPRNDDGRQVTRDDVKNGFRATIQEYKAESIIQWHTSNIGGAPILDLLVLHELETEIDPDDDLGIKRINVNVYRIYRLTDNGVTVQIARDKDGDLSKDEEIPVVDSSGAAFKRIPFEFVGSKDNKPDVDKAPLETVADINLGHYQESANLASSSYQLSAAQPWIADDNYQRYQKNDETKSDVELGENSMVVLGSGGRFEITAAPANTMAGELMESYKTQMAEAGAQIITEGGQAETAEAARIKHASDVSVLSLISQNISEAYTKCLEYAAMFMGVNAQNASFNLNSNFFDGKLVAEEVNSLVALWQSGAISKSVLDGNLQKGAIIPKDLDLDEMNDEIDSELILNGGINGSGNTQPSTDRANQDQSDE